MIFWVSRLAVHSPDRGRGKHETDASCTEGRGEPVAKYVRDLQFWHKRWPGTTRPWGRTHASLHTSSRKILKKKNLFWDFSLLPCSPGWLWTPASASQMLGWQAWLTLSFLILYCILKFNKPRGSMSSKGTEKAAPGVCPQLRRMLSKWWKSRICDRKGSSPRAKIIQELTWRVTYLKQ